MRPFIEQMQGLTAGDMLSWAGVLTILGFGLWAAAQIITAAGKLYADLAGQRAKERDNG